MVLFADTIVALSSGRLPSGIGIVRVSGPQTRFVVETICGLVPEPRKATFRHMRAASGEIIDSGPILFFEGPRSFTGEDSAEFHMHGGKAVVSALLSELTTIDSVRLADAGEFTKRAYLNGKVDLLKAEALADLVSSETEAQRKLAVLNAEGAQSTLYLEWRRELIHARAMIEAELDFSDEQDVPGSVASTIWAAVETLSIEMESHIAGYRQAEIIRDGFDVVIVGAPNAGKSSLLNALAKRDVAIVSDEPGTTRDLVEVVLDLDGMKCRITDTAGIRSDAGHVEAMGIERARKRAEAADLVIVLVDEPSEVPAGFEDREIFLVRSKSDVGASKASRAYDLELSSKTGAGMDELLAYLKERLSDAAGRSGEVLPSRMRHVGLLKEALESLFGASSLRDNDLELAADCLRMASDALGRIAGAVDAEDLLDVIFSEFCIGK